jgi:hypothetical protein
MAEALEATIPIKIRYHQRFAQANPFHPRAKLFKHISHISDGEISETMY